MNQSNRERLSFSQLFVESFRVFRRNQYDIITLATIPFMAFSIFFLYFSGITLENYDQIHPAIVFLLGILLFISQVLIYPIVIYIVQQDQLHRFTTARQGFSVIKRKFTKLFLGLLLYMGLMFLISLAVAALLTLISSSTLLVSLVSIFLSVIVVKVVIDLLFYQQAIIIKEKNPIQAFQYSRSRTKNKWWQTFFYYFFLDFIVVLSLGIVNTFIGLIPNHLVTSILQGFVQAIGTMFTQIFITLIFITYEDQDKNLLPED